MMLREAALPASTHHVAYRTCQQSQEQFRPPFTYLLSLRFSFLTSCFSDGLCMGLFISFFFTLFDVLCVWNSSTVPSLKSEINCSSFLFLFYRNNELPKKVYRNGVLLVYNYQPMCCCSWFGVVAVVVQCCCCYCCCCCCCVRACVRVCVCVCACVVVFAVVSFL